MDTYITLLGGLDFYEEPTEVVQIPNKATSTFDSTTKY